MAKHTISSLWAAMKQIALSDNPEEGAEALLEDIRQEAKKEVGEYQPGHVMPAIDTEGEEKPSLDSSKKA